MSQSPSPGGVHFAEVLAAAASATERLSAMLASIPVDERASKFMDEVATQPEQAVFDLLSLANAYKMQAQMCHALSGVLRASGSYTRKRASHALEGLFAQWASASEGGLATRT